jgi:hypothetical protein
MRKNQLDSGHNCFPWDPPNKREIGIALEGAYVIALKTLGQKWVERNIAPTPGQNKSDFMKRGLGLEQDRLIHVDRVIYLAEFLDRLANVKNFTSKLKDLKTNLLRRHSLSFRSRRAFTPSRCYSNLSCQRMSKERITI